MTGRATARPGGSGTTAGSGAGNAAARVAWGLAGLFVAIFATVLWLDRNVYATYFPDLGRYEWLGLHGVWLAPFVVFAVVGAVIASRRPRHAIGWTMLAAALASGTGEAMRMYAALAIGPSQADPPSAALWLQPFSEPLTVTGIVIGLVIIPLLFPTGRLVSRRWRSVVWLAGLMPLAFLLNSILSPRLNLSLTVSGTEGPVELYDVANPLSPAGLQDAAAAVPTGAATALLPVLIVLAGAAVIVRFRRSEGTERQQMKWFVYAAALVAFAAIGYMTGMLVFGADPPMVAQAMLILVGLSAYPVAVGVAVLRYRLYEIDRIISRTVAYGLIIAVLGGVYVAGVLGLGAALTAVTGQGDRDVVIAISTLAVAGLFRPVQTRIQTAVDRRFNRPGYEARLAVEAFAGDVRDEVDLTAIRRKVAETAAVAAQPSQVSIWLTDGEEQQS